MADPAQKNLIEMKKAQPNVQSTAVQFGDFPSFIAAILWSLIGLLAISYIGSTSFIICDPRTDLKQLFPIDLNKPPYKYPADAKDSNELFDKMASGSTEELGKDMMEYLYPMQHPAFPYYSFFIPVKYTSSCQESVSYVLAKWYAMTCAGAFAKWRMFYLNVALIGRWMLSTKSTIADLFIFYVYSYMIYYLILLPVVIPFIGGTLAVISSFMGNIPGGFAFTFSFMFGWLFGVANLFKTGIFSPYSWALFFFLGFAGMGMMFISMAWWGMVAMAIWAYSVAFMFVAPFYVTDGFAKLMQHFKAHRISMLIITLGIVLKASMDFMSMHFTIGVGVGGLYCLYKILQSACAASPAPAEAPKA